MRAKRSNPGKRSRNRVRDDRFLCILPATCHRERRSLSAIYRLLRRVAPRNDGKCAALSLAALNNFVCKANETYVHSVRAMPQAAQQSFACFSLLVRFLFLLRNQKEKMNNNLHNLCMWSIDAHKVKTITNPQNPVMLQEDFCTPYLNVLSF